MKKSIFKTLILALTGAAVLLAGSCQSDGVTSPSQKETFNKIPPPPPPPVNKSLHHEQNTGRPDTSKVYDFSEQMPRFTGGQAALMKFLHGHIHYPKAARENGIQGTVVVQFVVHTDGSLSNISTLGTPKGGGLEEEAMRVVKEMPDWKPGMKSGRKVAVRYSLPVRFVLQ